MPVGPSPSPSLVFPLKPISQMKFFLEKEPDSESLNQTGLMDEKEIHWSNSFN